MSPRQRVTVPCLAIAVIFAGATHADACFVRSPQPVQVWMDHVRVDIVDQVAVKTYDCKFLNPNRRRFVVGGTCYMELEPGTQVDNMTVTVDGKTMKAEILDVKRANAVFADIVKNGGSPALLEYYGNQLISTKLPRIKPGGTVTVRLRYTTVLKKRGGAVRLQLLNTNPKALMQPLKSAGVTVRLRSKVAIKNVYSPTHEIKLVEEKDWDIVVKWSQNNYLPKHPFVVYYQTTDSDFGATLLAHRELDEDGHFLLMVSPTMGRGAAKFYDEQTLPKDVVFCVDTSGSMLQDGKMEQARKALQYCVDNLRSGDRFNIVDFGTAVRKFRQKGLVEVSDASRAKAKRHIEKLAARGGTAIQTALVDSLDLFGKGERLKMIVFLTDGLPTIGERDPKQILKTVGRKNRQNVRLFVFGQGTDVNTRLLDFLALNNRGESEYVMPKADSTKAISGFFDRVGSPVLTDIKIEAEGVQLKDVYPQTISDLYRGEQVIVAGRYSGHGKKKLRISGLFNGKRKTFEYDVEFPEVSTDDRNAFVPRVWAGRKVDFLLNEIRKSGKEEMDLVKEVTYLAKLYGIVTPYTSFLMTDDVAHQTRAVQLGNFVSRMRGKQGGLRGDAWGYAAVKNAKEQAGNRANLAKNGISGKMYWQAQLALQQEGKQQNAMTAIRYVGNRTFYNSKNVWYDSRYEIDKKVKIQNVDVGSKEYLALLKKNAWAAKYMAQGDVVLQMGKNWYRFQSRKRS
ncbi:MAG: VIT domain-containing protein [Planctomycetaceae bacterium]